MSGVCNEPGCPTLVDHGRCPDHQKQARRQADANRPSSSRRGYNRKHQSLRRQWEPRVATGTILCPRCHTFIRPGQPWDLGHDDHDRNIHIGPEHASCNRATKGRGTPTTPPPRRPLGSDSRPAYESGRSFVSAGLR